MYFKEWKKGQLLYTGFFILCCCPSTGLLAITRKSAVSRFLNPAAFVLMLNLTHKSCGSENSYCLSQWPVSSIISPFTKSLFFSSDVRYLKPDCLESLSGSHLEMNMGRPSRGSRSLFKAASASA